MHKIIRINVTKSRWNSPKKKIAELDANLTRTKFGELVAAGSDPATTFTDVNQTTDPNAITYSPPAEIILLEPHMTVDSIGSGRTVEENLTQIGDVYKATLPVSFFRNVWFDYLEAYPIEHWVLSGNYVVPEGDLIAGTEVRGRYVVR